MLLAVGVQTNDAVWLERWTDGGKVYFQVEVNV